MKDFLDVDNWIPKYKRVRFFRKLDEDYVSQVEELTILCATKVENHILILKLRFKEQSMVLK